MPNNSLRNNELPPECTPDQYELSAPAEIGRERGLDIIVPIYGHILPAWPVRLVN